MDAILGSEIPLLFLVNEQRCLSRLIYRWGSTRGYEVKVIDCHPQMEVYDLLGNFYPIKDTKDVVWREGLLTENLMIEGEEGQGEKIVIWIRNIDKLQENVRLSLNDFLITSQIEIQAGAETKTYVKPSSVCLIADMDREQSLSVSAPFLNQVYSSAYIFIR